MTSSAARQSLLVLSIAFAAVVVATLALTALLVGDSNPATAGQRDGEPSSAPGVSGPAATGVGGVLAITGDRADALLLDREVVDDAYALLADGGRVVFEGTPATVSRIELDGLSFYLDPGDCDYSIGERDESSGLAALGVSCVAIGDIRETVMLSVEGSLRLPADRLGVRGELPATGGRLTIGDEILAFEQAAIDLRRPEVIETGRGSYSRYPPIYPVLLPAEHGALEFEYDSTLQHLRLVRVDVAGAAGRVEDGGCTIATRRLGQLSPRVTVVEMTLECAGVDLAGVGSVPLSGSLVVDVAELPATGLR